MTLGEFRKLVANVPDEAGFNFRDPNFGGKGEEIDEHVIDIHPQHGVLLSPPLWEPCD